MKVHLIDGTFELFRSYYGAPSRHSPSGAEVGATVSFLRSLYRFLQRPDVTHVAVAFDHVIESFRNDLFEGYKTGEGLDREISDQFEWVEEATRALGVVAWPMVEFEADDAIATAAIKFARSKRVEQVVLCTPDKDLCQVVRGKRIVLWDRLREKTLDERGVEEKFGVGPKLIPDYLAWVGDDADGIPGVPRWGAKSSSVVLAEYGGIEKIPSDYEKWSVKVRGAASLSEQLEGLRQEALLYRRLATLRFDVPISEKLDDLKWKQVNYDQLVQFCTQIGDRRFIERLKK